MEKLKVSEQATNDRTREHIAFVSKNLHIIVKHLLDRADKHDACKLESPEVEVFTEYTPRLAKLTFGSPEYNEILKEMQPALDHHYANSRHHPEHYKNGITDMNLVDLIEMMADWYASAKRQNNGNLHKSIEINAKRFNIDPELVKILENSVELFE